MSRTLPPAFAERARQAGDKAVSLAPDRPEGYLALGYLAVVLHDFSAALEQFASVQSDLVESLLEDLTKLKQLTTTGYAQTYPRKHDDAFWHLNNRVAVQRVEVAEGLRPGEKPKVSSRYRPPKRSE
jgi:predicted RecB family endonuclease